MAAVILCFKEDFERFFALMNKQVEICPKEVWEAKIDNWFFWQHVYHTLVCDMLYAHPQPLETADWSKDVNWDVAMLKELPQQAISKDHIKKLAQTTKVQVDAYFASLGDASLTEPHPTLTKLLEKDRTHQHALIALSRHCCYHLGCLDAALRSRGIEGVY